MKKGKTTPLEAENKVMKFFAATYGSLSAAIAEKYGEEGRKLVYESYRKSVRETCVPSWKTMKRLDAQGYAEWLLDDLMEGYQIEYVEKTPDSVRLRIKSCPLSTFFRAKGYGKPACIFCDVDYDMIKDFNETTGATLAFERDKTLIYGDDHCNHHVYVRK
jgi:hypothetical protein